ncbi:tetratricopeptide repeat protein [Massilia sp. erpn]|uniref:tetratricopeptide repeat protein n=1 Tax=Massilia sp. erpn TaxID=2738142 RepID=UPI002103FAEB|nr:tetratricopeptide repeat protein [Massilia sp. erpn]UTY57615.1 sel1 repeat family protein [Massilia sp. erpn]
MLKKFFLLSLVFPLIVQARPMDYSRELTAANRALARGDYADARAGYLKHSKTNPLAQFSLGLLYQNGWGQPRDGIQACRWFERSAQKNIPTAQHFFGDCLDRGIHRPADPKMALDFYLRAARGGHLLSLCSAAQLYIDGRGVDQDVAQGLDLCAQAAQAGSPQAMLRLANYFRGTAQVKPDLTAARAWYQMAAERDVPEAQYWLARMLSEGAGGAADAAQAAGWMERAAMGGHAPAYLPTAVLYANAPLDPATKTLPATDLAKVYLWNSAAQARSTDPEEQVQISKINELLQEIVPASWRPKLDRQVSDHLARFAK